MSQLKMKCPKCGTRYTDKGYLALPRVNVPGKRFKRPKCTAIVKGVQCGSTAIDLDVPPPSQPLSW
jgi:hypothetical protein